MIRVWLNGEFLDADIARIDPSDRGFLLGDGAFETMRADAGAVRRWPRHRDRLEGALTALEIRVPDWDRLEQAAVELCRTNGLDPAIVRLTVSRGALGAGMTAPAGAGPTVLLTTRPLTPTPLAVKARFVDGARRDGRNFSSRFKLSGYADMLAARRDAVRQGADMALLLSAEGHVSCADSANLFWIRAGRIYTPDLSCGCLPGTSRAALIAALKAQGEDVIEGRFLPQSVLQADGAFVTNAVQGVLALSQVNDCAFPNTDGWLARLKALCDAAL